jgi:hypothetical protein
MAAARVILPALRIREGQIVPSTIWRRGGYGQKLLDMDGCGHV